MLLVDRHTTYDKTIESFSRRISELHAQEHDDATYTEKLKKETDALLVFLKTKVKSKLVELEGDGILTAGEVKDELGEIRDSFEQELETIVSAMRAGSQPPPVKRNFDSPDEYLAALTHYTLLVRNALNNWLYLFASILVGLISAWGLHRLARNTAQKLTKNEISAFSHTLNAIAGPLYLGAIVCGIWYGLQSFWIPSSAHELIHRSLIALSVIAVFWFLWNACPGVSALITHFIKTSYNDSLDEHVENILTRFLRMAVISASAVVIVNIVLDTSFTGLLTGLGVMGLAIYFMLRGTIENVAASFTIFGDEPFRIGDLIVYAEEWGNVENIGFRSTKVRTLKGHLLTIPNRELVDNSVHNVGARPSIRRRFRIGLTYDTPPEKVREAIKILTEMLNDHEGMPKDVPPKVVFESFGDYDLRLLVQYNYEPPEFWQALEFDSEINLRILSKFAEADIEIAYPTETQIIEPSENTLKFFSENNSELNENDVNDKQRSSKITEDVEHKST